MSNDDINYFSVLLEEIKAQNKAVLDAVGDMQRNVAKLPSMEQDISELKQDTKIVKAAVTDVSRQVHDHERQIAQLKAA